MPPKRARPPHNTDSAPSSATDVMRRLLGRFYRDVRTLAELVEAGEGLLREDDSPEFCKLVEETVFASVDEGELPRLKAANVTVGSVSMSEVIYQVQHRVFAAHAKVFHREKKAGRPAFATPKNVLALGYRLSTDRTKEMSQAHGSRVSFVNVAANTIISSLSSSRVWDTLLSRVGPDVLIEVFSNPSIAVFTSLPNACYLQVGGIPLAELKTLDIKPSDAERGPGTGRQTHVRTKRKRRRRGGRKDAEGDVGDDEADDKMEVDTPADPPPPRIPSVVVFAPLPLRTALRTTVSAPLLPSSACSFAPSLAAGKIPTQAAALQLGGRALRPTQSLASVAGSVGVAERPAKRRELETVNSSNSVVLSRHRVYHNRVARVRKGQLAYGFPAKHIFTRLSDLFPSLQPPAADAGPVEKARGEAPARHLAKYVFPRQFGLHNPFTSPKPRSSFEVQPDYVDRELEIKKLGSFKTPPRLKSVLPILTRLAILSQRCNYRKLLDQRCPSKITHKRLDEAEKSAVLDLVAEPRTQVTRADHSLTISHASLVLPRGGTQAEAQVNHKPKLAEYACSFYEVESYVKSVVSQVIPRAFWGSTANEDLVKSYISSFVRLRRWESPSVHALLQGFALLDCAWLAPPSAAHKENKQQKANALDLEKRRELLSDFLFWLFDGFIIDLVRTAFYVTDAATHQNRPLYFRQDDWNALCAPLLANLGRTVFEKVPASQLIPLQRKRELGFSFVRLLPKETGVRPIVNLARRPLKIGSNGQKEVGQPINKVLQGVFDVLTFEKKRNPHLVGSLVSDPLGIFGKLKNFKTRLLGDGGELPKLYFVKVDVRACFDTIQQDKLLEIVEEILSETVYWIQKYSKVTPAGQHAGKQFKRQACDLGQFEELAQALAEELHSAVLADSVVYSRVFRDKLMQLLREHITTNLVKVGGRLFRQKDGIPQGSILSSLLCSLFYGDMEQKKLAFTDDPHSVLLRYVDDFLFISTRKELATKFLRVMDGGIPEYGCYISAEKRLTNFDVALRDGEVVPPLSAGEAFSWCGLAIDTRTLDIQFSTQSQMEKEIVDQLTIQRDRKPGQAFINAMFRAVKVRTHVLYSDTSYNSPTTAYSNVYRGMVVVALKFQAYVQEWDVDARKKAPYLLKSIRQIVAFSHAALVHRAHARKARLLKVEFTLKRQWVMWLGFHAFLRALSRRPSVYSSIIEALDKEDDDSTRSPSRKDIEKEKKRKDKEGKEKRMKEKKLKVST